MHDSDIFNFLKGFAVNKKDLKTQYINDYINGRITKAQLDEKMKNLK